VEKVTKPYFCTCVDEVKYRAQYILHFRLSLISTQKVIAVTIVITL